LNKKAKNFSGKVVVVTGSSAGLGKAIALGFAKQGADIALISRNQARLEKVKKEIEALGSRAIICALDVADAQGLDQAAEEIENNLGSIDIWVNNAMVSVFSPVKAMLPEEFRRVMEVNFLGTVYGTLSAMKRMQKRNQGVILQIGSVLAYRGIPLQSAYCASKHAVQGFHDSMRAELIHEASKVRVSMIQLPGLNTTQFDWIKSRMPKRMRPVPPVFQPEVAVEAVLWAAKHECRELNVTFTSSLIIFGNKFLPGFGDWYLAKTNYQGQQDKELEDPHRPQGLWESVDGDFGSHGRFDQEAYDHSWYLWVQTRLRPRWVILILFILIFLLLAFLPHL